MGPWLPGPLCCLLVTHPTLPPNAYLNRRFFLETHFLIATSPRTARDASSPSMTATKLDKSAHMGKEGLGSAGGGEGPLEAVTLPPYRELHASPQHPSPVLDIGHLRGCWSSGSPGFAQHQTGTSWNGNVSGFPLNFPRPNPGVSPTTPTSNMLLPGPYLGQDTC